MKRFTKGCLTTALILFLVGIVICSVCGLLGGFRQLAEMDGIGGIPFGYHRDDAGNWQFGFFNTIHRGERIGKDWEKERYLRLSEGKDNEVSLNAASCTELDIELAECSLYLEESKDDQIRVYITGDTLRYYWLMDGSSLCLRNAGRRANHTKDEVHVSIPAGHRFKEVEIDFGAGVLDAVPLQAAEMDINIGAGVCTMQEVSADEADVAVGAGQLFVVYWNSKKANIDVGAGEFNVLQDMKVSDDLEINMNMGSAEINGTVSGDLSLECGMGTVNMNLTGSEDDHGYAVACGMGSVQVGHHSHGGFASSESWNSGKAQASLFDIDCSMGSVTITFEH